MCMTPDEFGLRGIRVNLKDSDLKADQIARALRVVERSITDPAERREVALALGLAEPDFWWESLPGRRGKGSQIKHIKESTPPPERQEETHDPTQLSSTDY